MFSKQKKHGIWNYTKVVVSDDWKMALKGNGTFSKLNKMKGNYIFALVFYFWIKNIIFSIEAKQNLLTFLNVNN